MKPKFKLGDIVCYKDEHNFNPADKALTIAQITGIHLVKSSGLFENQAKVSIVYSLSTSGLRPRENQLKLWI